MKEKIHIGKMIQNKMIDDGRSVQWLAKKLHCGTSNIYKIYEKSSINSELLLHISYALETNFFAYYSYELDKIIK